MVWRILFCKLIFVICTDSLCLNYLRRILFDLSYGRKGKNKRISFRMSHSIGSRFLLHNAFGEVKGKSRSFRFYYFLYFLILFSILPSYAVICIFNVLSRGEFSWIDISIGTIKITTWIFLRLHFDRSNNSIFIR